MLNLLHRLAAIPWVYDLIQFALGFSYSRNRVRQHVKQLPSGGQIVDIGAGTGLWRSLWGSSYHYLCIDIDQQKLEGFKQKYVDSAILGDATQLPFADQSIDIIVCIAIVHHLTTPLFEQLLIESKRVLKPKGIFLFLEPLQSETRFISRFLWALDRGSYPRTRKILENSLERHFTIQQVEYFAVYHTYILATYLKN